MGIYTYTDASTRLSGMVPHANRWSALRIKSYRRQEYYNLWL